MDGATKQQLIQLVQRADLDQVIELLLQMNLVPKYRRVAIAISRQFHRLKLDRMKGTTTLQEQQLIESQVADRLVELIESIKVKRDPEEWKLLGYLRFLFSLKGFQFFWGYISSSVVNGKLRWRQWGAIFAAIILVSGGFLLASNWPMRWYKEGTIGKVLPPRPCRSYVAVVTDTQGNPQGSLIAKLASGRIAPVKTDQHGILNFWEYLSEYELGDTLELYQNDFCVARRAIQFPGRGKIVVETKGDVPMVVPPRLDTCKVAKRLLPFSKEVKGKIFVWQEDALSSDPPGVEGIHVFVKRRGCPEPVAETWTDGKGDYVLHLDSAAPYPDSIVLEDPYQRHFGNAEKFILKRPKFDYPIRKK